MDSDESRDLSSASDSDSDGETQPSSRQRSQSDSPSSRGRSNSSSSDSETEKQNVIKPKSGSSSSSRSSRSRSLSVDSKTNKSSQNSTPQPPESRSGSVSSPKSPHSRAGSRSPGHKSPISRSASKSPISRSTSTGSKVVHSPKSLDQSNRSAASSVSPENRNVRVKSPQASGDRNRSPIIREGQPRSPSVGSTRSNSSIANQNNLEHYPHSPVNGRCKSISPDRRSRESSKSDSSRTSKIIHEAANLDDGITSDSSDSSEDNISRHRKGTGNEADTRPEDISDDVDSEIERKEREEKERQRDAIQKESVANLQMAHEDLSDVSDLDAPSDDDDDSEKSAEEDIKLNECPSETEVKKLVENNARPDEGEEQLDFEAEDGECAEPETPKDKEDSNNVTTEIEKREATDIRESEKMAKEKELEEGELTDEDEARPEETEPRPVCRFFSRGQCTWGASCRFLHPGVTDKGNYTMFEMIRPIVPGEFGHERMFYGRPEPPPMESAWERGLRTAKEMLRKSMKRKEQDIDFEEKKMNLSLTQEELDKENGYYTRGPSPEPRYAPSRHVVPVDYTPAPVVRPQPEEYYARRQVIYEPEYVPPPRERPRPYREMPAHRVPDYYPTKYEEDPSSSTKLRKPKREVIVQRVEEDRRPARGDEWSDPWMRSKSPAGRKGRRRSYSSGSSYSSSSSSRSSSGSSRSSYRSRSSRRQRTSSRRHKRQVSPSVIVSERKAANERAALMNPPAPRKKAPSPGMMRAGAQNPPAPAMKVDQFGRTRSKLAVAAALARVKGRTRASRSHSSSGSSSASSSSDSDSSGSSSSSSRERSPPRRPTGVDLAMALKAKAIDALKSGTEKRQIKLNLKTAPSITKKPDLSELTIHHQQQQGKKRSATSMGSPPISSGMDASSKVANKKASSRREELLKQLKAVEDAIAKKRSKVN